MSGAGILANWNDLCGSTALDDERFEKLKHFRKGQCKKQQKTKQSKTKIKTKKGVDTSVLKKTEPMELKGLTNNHPMKKRFEKENEEGEFGKHFTYVGYFKKQMTEQRAAKPQLPKQQQEMRKHLMEQKESLERTLSTIEEYQSILNELSEIYHKNETTCQEIHSQCTTLIEEQVIYSMLYVYVYQNNNNNNNNNDNEK
ncbi:hypothetical protein RFI_34605 [Reticulomyxa filosa]|uniref:Uncharacterized protein n=1 Tax=Reticulomyxa filosa TaxID=46433 RepID=X6LN60_RETFI|nr:hypothetical protein RFI_34605 [Reticulomyxa filosa]|eukprot:ETO02806.1 hypothetical protein RFI_34605 [Reticulomyxa filosa]